MARAIRSSGLGILTRTFAAFALTGGSLAAQSGRTASECFGVRPPSGTIGIGRYECVGSACVVNQRLEDGYAHLFTTEPSVWEIDRDGPAAGRLQEGDVLVSINGLLITSRAGGRLIANLPVGRPAALLIRRGESRFTVTLSPVQGCEIPQLAVLGARTVDAVPTRLADDRSPVDFGMRLDCGDCGWRLVGGQRQWFASRSPIVMAITPGGPAADAGVQVGDVLDELDGMSLVAPNGSAVIGSLRAGTPVTLTLRRAGTERRLRIVPRANR